MLVNPMGTTRDLFRGDGIRVVDVWTSREAFDRTLTGEFAEQAEALNFPEPEISFYDVHTTLKSPDL